YKTDKGRKSSFMRDIFISYWINYKKRQKRKKLEGTLFGHPLLSEKIFSVFPIKSIFCILIFFTQMFHTYFLLLVCIF
ncbi:MAG: hypothetical protein UC662_07585, partial [Paraprevotella clara]|nr:hypothetical protein [Paraprevotella clara]